jgi:putative DNA methylase
MHEESLRLIEDCLPLDIISDRAAREKNQHTGNLASIHIWWGRKPQIAARAATYAALVPAPHDAAQRTAYLHQLAALCTTDVSAGVLRQARRQIAEIHAERMRRNGTTPASRAPLVLDLFAGGGSIPLEALRLGCDALASDLNPVAYLIELCTIVYPQRYPDIAQLVATWGRRLLEQVRAAVADLYPPIPMVMAESASMPGESAMLAPLAYLWTRTVACPNPQCGATVPLTQHTWLINRPRQAAALRIVPHPDLRSVAFTFAHAPSSAALGFSLEGLSARGNARCFCCGATVASVYVKREGKAGWLGVQLMAAVGRHSKARVTTSPPQICRKASCPQTHSLHRVSRSSAMPQG